MVAATPRPENSSYHPFVRRPSDDPVGAGRDALDRHAWNEAYGILTEADRAGSLGGEGLWLLASAAYWTAHPDETVEALERAFGAYLKEGDRASAAMMAYRVAEQHGMRLAMPQAMGWAARAQRLGEENPTWPVHAWLAWMNGLLAWFQRDFDAAIARYDEALELASRSGDRNLYWMSIHDKGHALCLLGKVDEGMTLLDEAMAAVVGGELDPEPAGYVYCGMIGACSKLGGLRAGVGVDRGHAEVVRASICSGVPRRLPDPQGRADEASRVPDQGRGGSPRGLRRASPVQPPLGTGAGELRDRRGATSPGRLPRGRGGLRPGP